MDWSSTVVYQLVTVIILHLQRIIFIECGIIRPKRR